LISFCFPLPRDSVAPRCDSSLRCTRPLPQGALGPRTAWQVFSFGQRVFCLDSLNTGGQKFPCILPRDLTVRLCFPGPSVRFFLVACWGKVTVPFFAGCCLFCVSIKTSEPSHPCPPPLGVGFPKAQNLPLRPFFRMLSSKSNNWVVRLLRWVPPLFDFWHLLNHRAFLIFFCQQMFICWWPSPSPFFARFGGL